MKTTPFVGQKLFAIVFSERGNPMREQYVTVSKVGRKSFHCEFAKGIEKEFNISDWRRSEYYMPPILLYLTEKDSKDDIQAITTANNFRERLRYLADRCRP